MASVPRQTPSLLNSLRTTMTGSATLRDLLGATTTNEASARMYDRFANDEPSESDEDEPVDGYPRVILTDFDPIQCETSGGFCVFAQGSLAALIEFKQFTAAELSDWYELDITDPTDHDHFQHADNLKTDIARELIAQGNPNGCLNATRITCHGVFRADHVCQKNRDIWVIPFEFSWEGLV
mgnify:CR=1 FL=1